MYPALIVSLIGILISIYKIADKPKKRNISYKFTILSLLGFSLLGLIFVISIILTLYYNTTQNQRNINIFNLNLTSGSLYSVISVLLLIVILIYFTYILFQKKIKRKTKFVKNLRKHFNNTQIGIVISDLDIFFQNLMKKYLPEGRKKTENSKIDKLMNRKQLSKFKTFWNKIYNFWNNRRIKFSLEFNSLFSDLLKDNLFVKKLIKESPYLGAKIINSDIRLDLRRQFVNKYLKLLLLNKKSILYTQVENNLTIYQYYRYRIFPENYIIFALFNNIEVADKLHVYKPIGDGGREYLLNQRKKDNDIENSEEVEIKDKPYNSPIFIAMILFDIMIKEAIAENIKSDMWLYYYDRFVEIMVENIQYSSNPNGEFANMYEYYIYEIFVNYSEWIKFIFKNDVAYEVKLRSTNCSNKRNDNIIKSSIISMSRSMNHIIDSDVRDNFEIYIFDEVITLYIYLATRDKKEANRYGEVLKNCIFDKINTDRVGEKFHNTLCKALEKFDELGPKYKNGIKKYDKFKEEVVNYNPSENQ